MAKGDDHWKRQLLVGVVVLVIVGLLVGGIVSVAALKAADVAGLSDDSTTTTTEPTGTMPLPGRGTEKSQTPSPSKTATPTQPTDSPQSTAEGDEEGSSSSPDSTASESESADSTDATKSTKTTQSTKAPESSKSTPSTTGEKKNKKKKDNDKKAQQKSGALTLTASPKQASTWQRVNLVGTWQGHDGASLQVQRSIDGGPWSNFPTSATVSDGEFSTYILTGRTGTNRFRVVDTSTGKTSNVVTVQIS